MKNLQILERDYESLKRTIEFLQQLADLAETRSETDEALLNYAKIMAIGINATRTYLTILGRAIKLKPGSEEKLLQFPSGRSRSFFGRSANEIEMTGKNTHPKPIPETKLYALTNCDTAGKRDLMTQALRWIGYEKETARKVSELI